jgi:hypothetical protein
MNLKNKTENIISPFFSSFLSPPNPKSFVYPSSLSLPRNVTKGKREGYHAPRKTDIFRSSSLLEKAGRLAEWLVASEYAIQTE